MGLEPLRGSTLSTSAWTTKDLLCLRESLEHQPATRKVSLGRLNTAHDQTAVSDELG